MENEQIEYEAEVAICPECGEIIADSRLESENLKTAYTQYRNLCSLKNKDK